MGAEMTVAELSFQQKASSFQKWVYEHSGALALSACFGFWAAVSTTLYLAL
jgi:hypothetical protein